MINSCPRAAWPNLPASALAATRMVSSCTSVPRWASANANGAMRRMVVANVGMATQANRSFIIFGGFVYVSQNPVLKHNPHVPHETRLDDPLNDIRPLRGHGNASLLRF